VKIGQLRSLKGLSMARESEPLRPAPAVDLSPLTNLTRLRGLSLGQWGGITPAAVEALSRLPELEMLDLSDTDVTAEGLAKLRDCKRLSQLYICDLWVTQADLFLLADIPNLKELSFGPMGFDSQAELDRFKQALPGVSLSPELPVRPAAPEKGGQE
jgi:hypothetical protein